MVANLLPGITFHSLLPLPRNFIPLGPLRKVLPNLLSKFSLFGKRLPFKVGAFSLGVNKLKEVS